MQAIPRDYFEVIENLSNNIIERGAGVYFVTGASGFLGNVFVNTLHLLNETKWKNNPCKIVVLVRDRKRYIDLYGENKNVEYVVGGLTNIIEYEGKIDYIIHSAGVCNSLAFTKDPVGVLESNLIGTYNVLEFAKTKNIKSMVFVSSGYIYSPENDEELKEDRFVFSKGDMTKYNFSYITSKIAAETLCNSYYKQYNLPITVIRPFNIYGPGQDVSHGGILTEVLRAGSTKRIEMKSEGKALRNFIYVYDVVSALFYSLFEGVYGEVYNVSGSQNILVKDFVLQSLKIYQDIGVEIEYINEKQESVLVSDEVSYNPSNKKLQLLGWKEIVTLEQGLERTISSFLEK